MNSSQYDSIGENLVEEFLLVKQSENLSPKTLTRYEYSLKQLLKYLEDKVITKIFFIEYNNFLLSKKHSDWYVRGNQQVIKAFFMYLIENGYKLPIPKFKLQKIHLKKLCYLETPEISKLLKANLSIKERLVIRLLLVTGLRLNEAVNLKWNDINFSNGKILVHHGKGDKFRIVVIDKETSAFLLRYKNKKNLDNNSPVLHLTKSGVTSMVKRVREREGIFFTPHALRRTYARQSVINGLDIVWLQQLLGHSSLDLTKSYIGQLDTDNVIMQYHNHSPLKGI